ncbi:hypothetical protein [Bacteroides sp. UBA939]|uniref:hypothetical protein n=1 Tax=Bacteroides sp. UBA939 TaxID=1946092 RepID=UPI0039C8763E
MGLRCTTYGYQSDSGIQYSFNTGDKLNGLLLDLLQHTGQLPPGKDYDLDFDHQFLATEKYDTRYSYKKARGYFPGIATIGSLIVGLENRDLFDGNYVYRCIVTNDWEGRKRISSLFITPGEPVRRTST